MLQYMILCIYDVHVTCMNNCQDERVKICYIYANYIVMSCMRGQHPLMRVFDCARYVAMFERFANYLNKHSLKFIYI